MQLRTFYVLALLAAPAASESVAALSAAKAWLEAHAAPSGDELGELKTVNPQAYALVKALLAKRSLGLLDPRHPNAKFSQQAVQQDSVEQGPEAFAKFASPGELRHEEASPVAKEAALPYAEVQPAAHHDWMNWKPQDSAANDDAMVQNVLGAVAELKGKKAGLLSKHRSSLTADEAFDAASEEPRRAVEKPAAPKQEGNGYLDFGVMTTPDAAPAKPAKKENSYLKGLNLMGDDSADEAADSPQRTLKVKSTDSSASGASYLDSFSWGDEPAVQEKPKPKHVAPQVKTKEASLLNWLGVEDKAPAPQEVQAKKPVNPYISDLLS